MKMKKSYIITVVLLLLSLQASAQHSVRRETGHSARRGHAVRKSYLNDTYGAYADSLQSLRSRFAQWRNKKPDTLSNPYYFPLFASPTFYDHAVSFRMQSADSASARLGVDSLACEIGRLLTDVYVTRPWLIRHLAEAEGGGSGLRDDIVREVKPEIKLSEKAPVESVRHDMDDALAKDWDIVVRRPNFWKFKTNFSFHFMQNHVSDNWYKGGESYNSMLAATSIEATYNNKQKVVFSNTLEMKLGFQTSRKDEEHKYKTNTDLLRLTNKLGLRATKHWYYTIMLQSNTQFCRGYKANDAKVYSDFMSPFECVFSIGMDYKLNVKKFNVNATISPFACNFKYVDRKSLATSFGLTEGRHTKYEFGSTVTVNYDWDVIKNVHWKGRIFYFTDYDRAQIEWENTFTMIINKALTAKLFLYPRFDDNVNRKEGDSYFQFNETLSLGLELSF